MKTVVLFGAGQFGAMISRLIGTGYAISCFADNSEGKWGTTLAGIPVVSPRESLLFDPDCFCLCVMDGERAGQMEAQIRELGFDGQILRPEALRTFDARVATMRLLAEQIHETEDVLVIELGFFIVSLKPVPCGIFGLRIKDSRINQEPGDRIAVKGDLALSAGLGKELFERKPTHHMLQEEVPGVHPGWRGSLSIRMRNLLIKIRGYLIRNFSYSVFLIPLTDLFPDIGLRVARYL